VTGPAGPGFRQIIDFDGAALRRAAHAWGALAARVRLCSEAMVAPLHSLDEWEGPAAQVARLRAGRLGQTVRTAGQPLDSHREILSALAGSAGAVRDRARSLVAEAAAAGVSIDADGRVMAAGGLPARPAPGVVEAYRSQVREVLAEAARLDAQARHDLATHRPWTGGRSRAFVPLRRVPPPGSAPATVHRWWGGLDPAERRYLIMMRPELVGGLDGVPVVVRDQANRIVLARARADLRDRLAELEQRWAEIRRHKQRLPGPTRTVQPGELAITIELDRVREKLAALDLLARRLAVDPASGTPAGPGPGPRPYLLALDTTGPGRVILAAGNPDRADHVLTYVPGTGAALGSLRGPLARTERMAADAVGAAPAQRTAAVYWLGYHAPPTLLDATRLGYAEAAANDLRRFAEGLRATHTGDGSHNTFLGHSYGSTVVGTAARDGLRADDLIFVGSPGGAAGSATDFRIDRDPATHVWSTTARSDPIRLASSHLALRNLTVPSLLTPSGLLAGLPDQIHGNDPSDSGFGGRVFAADPRSGHSGYWDEGNVARTSIARIAVGRHGEVTR
jgi:hypothetical protein